MSTSKKISVLTLQLMRKLKKGNTVFSYSCNTLGVYIFKLHADASLEGSNALAARRTFAVKEHCQGRDLVYRPSILGHKSVIATIKRLVHKDRVQANCDIPSQATFLAEWYRYRWLCWAVRCIKKR